jgi:hypothetical protein
LIFCAIAAGISAACAVPQFIAAARTCTSYLSANVITAQNTPTASPVDPAVAPRITG